MEFFQIGELCVALTGGGTRLTQGPMSGSQTVEIHCTRRGACGHIRLDRPAALNAITLGMVRAIAQALDDWEHDPGVRCVVVESTGDKAFSAGGDIRLLYEQGRAGDHEGQLEFWREEYTLNRRIKTYPKPYVPLIDGIVMGGGVGVSIHGSHRIAGDRFALAMPESGIGFFPDVGGTYFLPRMGGRVGTYLALTGARIRAGGAVMLGLATAHVPSSRFAELANALADHGDVDRAIADFRTPPPASALAADFPMIDSCFAGDSVLDILARLDDVHSDRAREIASIIRKKSPTSLGIALRQMQIGGALDIDEAMQAEFRVVSRLCRDHDFLEGVRATIIDKDNRPRWNPAHIEDVTDARIDEYFAPLGADELTFGVKEHA